MKKAKIFMVAFVLVIICSWSAFAQVSGDLNYSYANVTAHGYVDFVDNLTIDRVYYNASMYGKDVAAVAKSEGTYFEVRTDIKPNIAHGTLWSGKKNYSGTALNGGIGASYGRIKLDIKASAQTGQSTLTLTDY